MRGRVSEERETASVQDQQISINTKWKCKAISKMNNVNKDITEGQKLESFKINTKQHYKYHEYLVNQLCNKNMLVLSLLSL